MSVYGIAIVRDEADIIEATVRNMLAQVDRVVVADNGSVDGTRALLDSLSAEDGRLEVLEDLDPAHYQSRKTSALAAQAAADGADWVIPFDADEIWLSPHGRIADVLADATGTIAPALLYNHVSTALDPAEDPVQRMGWRVRNPLGLPKVACRPSLPVMIAEGNHVASYPRVELAEGLLEVRHFPYRSAEQFLSKVRNGAAALAATDLPADVGVHWRQYGELLEKAGPEAVEDWFREHFFTVDPESEADLVFDPAPKG